MPPPLEKAAALGLLQLNPKTRVEKTTKAKTTPRRMSDQAWYDMRCACLVKAREARLAKLALKKKF
jgi:hypothetical protein